MIRLNEEQIFMLHTELIKSTGGIDGVRDINLLESALNTPFQSFSGIDLYPSIIQKIARLGYGIIKNHPFLDGNKRTGAHIILVLLELNGIAVEYSDKDLYATIMSVADGRINFDEFVLWIINHQIN